MGVEHLAAASFDVTADVRRFPRGEMRVVDLGVTVVGRAVFEPGWRWSEHVRPTAGTASCRVRHVGCIVSGRLAIRMDDGTESAADGRIPPSCLLMVRSCRWSGIDAPGDPTGRPGFGVSGPSSLARPASQQDNQTNCPTFLRS